MNTKIDFSVNCPACPYRKETIRVYYVKHEGKWFPLPPNSCDNANNSSVCQQRNADVLSQALQQTPPFVE